MQAVARKGLGIGVITVCGMLVSSAALAGHDHDKGAHKGGLASFKQMDTDGNGKLTAQEHANGARVMFEAMDADKDNKVTAAEMEAAHAQMMAKKADRGHHEGAMEMSASEKIAKVDTNGDGVLTAEEHAAGARAMFGAMDTDKNGVLTSQELKAGHNKMMKKTKDAKDATR